MARGRPKLVRDEFFALFQKMHPEIKSRRGILNKLYCLDAIKVVMEMEGTNYLFDKEKDEAKQSILIELGRLKDKECIKQVARYICKEAKKEKQTVHEWAEFVRRFGKVRTWK